MLGLGHGWGRVGEGVCVLERVGEVGEIVVVYFGEIIFPPYYLSEGMCCGGLWERLGRVGEGLGVSLFLLLGCQFQL